MRLKLLITTAAAAGLLSGAALAQTAEPSQSTIPPTNDPSTRTDDECGAHMGPKPCGVQVREVAIPAQPMYEPAPAYDPAPVADTRTTEMYSSPPMQPEVRTSLITNGPVPDTPENRARYGGPNSRAGQMTAPVGNAP